MPKPEIIVLSGDEEDSFRWLSNGWFDAKRSGTKKGQELMAKARQCVEEGENVPDVIVRLKKAGFKVTRSQDN